MIENRMKKNSWNTIHVVPNSPKSLWEFGAMKTDTLINWVHALSFHKFLQKTWLLKAILLNLLRILSVIVNSLLIFVLSLIINVCLETVLLSLEFTQTATATAVGFVVMGFVGYFVKLIHIPINNILIGA